VKTIAKRLSAQEQAFENAFDNTIANIQIADSPKSNVAVAVAQSNGKESEAAAFASSGK